MSGQKEAADWRRSQFGRCLHRVIKFDVILKEMGWKTGAVTGAVEGGVQGRVGILEEEI